MGLDAHSRLHLNGMVGEAHDRPAHGEERDEVHDRLVRGEARSENHRVNHGVARGRQAHGGQARGRQARGVARRRDHVRRKPRGENRHVNHGRQVHGEARGGAHDRQARDRQAHGVARRMGHVRRKPRGENRHVNHGRQAHGGQARGRLVRDVAHDSHSSQCEVHGEQHRDHLPRRRLLYGLGDEQLVDDVNHSNQGNLRSIYRNRIHHTANRFLAASMGFGFLPCELLVQQWRMSREVRCAFGLCWGRMSNQM